LPTRASSFVEIETPIWRICGLLKRRQSLPGLSIPGGETHPGTGGREFRPVYLQSTALLPAGAGCLEFAGSLRRGYANFAVLIPYQAALVKPAVVAPRTSSSQGDDFSEWPQAVHCHRVDPLMPRSIEVDRDVDSHHLGL
jgi:hypothetical protein